jgi:hypothetical protein
MAGRAKAVAFVQGIHPPKQKGAPLSGKDAPLDADKPWVRGLGIWPLASACGGKVRNHRLNGCTNHRQAGRHTFSKEWATAAIAVIFVGVVLIVAHWLRR